MQPDPKFEADTTPMLFYGAVMPAGKVHRRSCGQFDERGGAVLWSAAAWEHYVEVQHHKEHGNRTRRRNRARPMPAAMRHLMGPPSV